MPVTPQNYVEVPALPNGMRETAVPSQVSSTPSKAHHFELIHEHKCYGDAKEKYGQR